MWQILRESDQLLLQDGYLYVPLLLDPEIAAVLAAGLGEGRAGETAVPAAAGTPPAAPVVCQQGRYFVQSFSLTALVEQFPAVFPEEYQRLRSTLLAPVQPSLKADTIEGDAVLRTVLFEVMPYFLRLRRSPRRRAGTAPALLDYLAASLPRPPQAAKLLARLRQRQADLRDASVWLQDRLDRTAVPPAPLEGGPALRSWFQTALTARIFQETLDHCHQQLQALRQLQDLPEPQLVQLLAIATRGEIELDGFGMQRDGRRPGVYWVYKKTGEFVLQDYYGRPYLFPSCRVAVSTAGPFHPVVLEHYKHPLLRRFGPRQPICLTDFQAAREFSAQAIIQALQAGLNALYFGYNSRKRNGYNSLDSFGRHLSVITFDDLRLPKDDPRLQAGTLEIKNT